MIPGIIAGGFQEAAGGGATTVALLHFDGTDGSTAVVDETGKTWTVSGSAQLDNAWAKFGSTSLLLPTGTGHFIQCTHADLAFGDDDFCIELWLRIAGFSNFTLLDNRVGYGGSASMAIYDSDGGADMQLCLMANGSIFASQNIVPITDYHVAWCRSSGQSRLFGNGTQSGPTYADSTNYDATTLRFGQNFINSAAGLNGWIDELRIMRGPGAGIYTANFTPPTAPYSL